VAANDLVYADTDPQDLADVQRLQSGLRPADTPSSGGPAVSETRAAPAPAAGGGDPRIQTIRGHLERYRTLVSQGRLAEAGRELEAVQALVER